MRARLFFSFFFFLLAIASACFGAARDEIAWTEVRSPNFTVVSSVGDKHGRNIAEQFELFRAVFSQIFPKTRVDLGKPLIIFAVKNEKELKELLPEYWEQKGRMHPAGAFQSGMEKLYVALRTDTAGEYPYHIIYHEYVHALMNLNADFLPLWLNEGIAEFYAHSYLANKEATLGRPSDYHLLNLRQQKLMTLEQILSATHDSPYYNENDKASVFYSQSWALTHFLMMNKASRDNHWLLKYLEKTTSGTPPLEAAQQVFGDLKAFGASFDSYVRQTAFRVLVTKPAAPIDEKTFPARALSAAEAAALLGNFYVHTQRPVEAKAKLDEALKLDPRNALAHESYGVYYLRKQDWPQAATWFEKATELDSKSFLAYYHAAVLVVQRGGFAAEFEKTERHLRRAIELNPNFAPSYANLATLYAANEEKLDEALIAAQQAAQLEPGFLGHRINVAQVLLRMKRVDEAIRLAERVSASARENEDSMMAASFLQQAREYKESLARYEAAKKAEEEYAKRRAAEAAEYEAAMAKRAQEEEAARAAAQLKPGEVAAYGTITQATCTAPDALQVRLLMGTATMTLRAAKRGAVEYTIGLGRPLKFNPCEQLSGQQAQVIYRPAKLRTQPGELVRIELLEDPVVTAAQKPAQIAAPAAKKVAVGDGSGSGAAGPSEARPSGPPGWSEGRITNVTCNGADLRITVDIGGGFSTRLRAVNYHKIDLLAAAALRIPDNFQPCTQLRGRNAEVKYVNVGGAGYDGEIISIELRP